MKNKRIYCLFIAFFSITCAIAQNRTLCKAQLMVDSLVRFGELKDTEESGTLFFSDIDSLCSPLEFINIKYDDQMGQIDSVCESANKDSIRCYVFSLWMDHPIHHFAFLFNDTLSIVNLNRPLDIIINDIYLYVRELDIDDETIGYIFRTAISYQYSNSWAAANKKYNPLEIPCKQR